MQYYFARTGLLDGKGAQLAKEREKKRFPISAGKENREPSGAELDDWNVSSLCLNDTAAYAVSESGQDYSILDSPTEGTENGDLWTSNFDPPMLPPTVSTYKQKQSHSEPLPDMPVLRRELKEALQDACKVLEEMQKNNSDNESSGESNGFYEIQGLHLLDIVTLAIRAAKNYYTAHTNPQKLYAFRSERVIRSDLYNVLDVLKRMASRNFRGGMRLSELTDIILWIESIDKLIKREEDEEQRETAEREAWVWRDGDWTGREREREWLFLKSFDPSSLALPRWLEPTVDQSTPSPFLLDLQDGQRLVKLHNALVSKSKRSFGEIARWHTDVGKPYRRAENLRFWIKASELRWEIKLDLLALDVVNGRAWEKFDLAVLKWCRGVRMELMEEWRLEALSERRRPPELRVEVPNSDMDVLEQATNPDAVQHSILIAEPDPDLPQDGLPPAVAKTHESDIQVHPDPLLASNDSRGLFEHAWGAGVKARESSRLVIAPEWI